VLPRTHPAHRRVLEAAARKGVALDIVTFPESTHTAEEAARAVEAELGQIVKSLVFVGRDDEGNPEPYVALVGGADRVDVGRLAAVVGQAEIRRASATEARELTGFTIGGIPPIGHARPAKIVMDPELGRFPTVWAAAGTPNAVFEVPPATLRNLSNATVAPIADETYRAARGSAPGNAPASAASGA
jgi:prolyl-tRNA editing enzyme YbaK/EbsC (Cys-tRNA(Pro) deacylase)